MTSPAPNTDLSGVVVYRGNRDAVETVDDPNDTAAADEGRAPARLRTPIPGKQCTTVRIPERDGGVTLAEAFVDITAPGGVWATHSDGRPAWVATDPEGLSWLLASHYGCERREPDPDHQPSTSTEAGAEAGSGTGEEQ